MIFNEARHNGVIRAGGKVLSLFINQLLGIIFLAHWECFRCNCKQHVVYTMLSPLGVVIALWDIGNS